MNVSCYEKSGSKLFSTLLADQYLLIIGIVAKLGGVENNMQHDLIALNRLT